MKVQYVIDLLKAHKNKFTVAQLTEHIRADAGDAALARRTRRALFVARKAGIVLEPIRDGGKAVTAYQLQGSIPDVVPVRKASRARTKTVTAKTISKEVSAIVAKNKAPSKKVAVEKPATKTASLMTPAEVKAKNLETMRKVSAKRKKLHPITNREMTDEEAAVLEEFKQLDAMYDTEEQTRAVARASVREYLTKESYVE